TWPATPPRVDDRAPGLRATSRCASWERAQIWTEVRGPAAIPACGHTSTSNGVPAAAPWAASDMAATTVGWLRRAANPAMFHFQRVAIMSLLSVDSTQMDDGAPADAGHVRPVPDFAFDLEGALRDLHAVVEPDINPVGGVH